MKRRITKQSLEELKTSLTMLTVGEQEYYVGGGSGTKEDPYTEVEYFRMLDSGTWSGGYVLFGYDVETYARNASGNWELLPPGVRYAFSDVVVTAPKRDKFSGVDGDPAGGTGSIPGSEDYAPSGVYPSDGNYWDNSQPSGNGGGTFQRGGGTSTPWDRITTDLLKYGITLKAQGAGYKTAEQVLCSILNRLSREKGTFNALLQRAHTHGLPIELSVKHLVAANPKSKRGGGTTYSTDLNGKGKVYVELDVAFLERHQNAINKKEASMVIERIEVGIAGTIIHEMIHARLQGVLGAYGIRRSELLDKTSSSYAKLHSEEFKNAYPGIFDYYSRCENQEELDQAEHNIIATHYRPTIVKILQETFPTISEKDCEALSWSGLDHTKAWAALDKDHRKNITNEIRKYKT